MLLCQYIVRADQSLLLGVAFMLMQKGLGLNSALKAGKWGFLWGVVTGKIMVALDWTIYA